MSALNSSTYHNASSFQFHDYHLHTSVPDGSLYTSTPFDKSPVKGVDIFLGILCGICMAVGTVTNITSVIYFLKKRSMERKSLSKVKDFFGILYIAISSTDLMICITILPVAEAFLNGRNSVMFGNPIFCAVWGLIWEIIPFYSVFLVGVMSISRLATLLKPHGVLNVNALLVCLGVYLAGLVLSKGVPLLDGLSEVKYLKNTMYCFILPDDGPYWMFSIVSSIALLAAPICPITITCIIMTYKLTFTKRVSRSTLLQKMSTSKQVEATKTILLVTAVYIFYNIPVFVKFLHHLLYVVRHTTDKEYDYKKAYNSVFLYWYGWVLTYTVCVVMNSASNPIVYFFRMKHFQTFVKSFSASKSFVGSKSSLGRSIQRRIDDQFKNANEIKV